MSTRWYVSQLQQLPPDARRRLTMQLRRSLRSGSCPSRRQWMAAVRQAYGGYRALAA